MCVSFGASKAYSWLPRLPGISGNSGRGREVQKRPQSFRQSYLPVADNKLQKIEGKTSQVFDNLSHFLSPQKGFLIKLPSSIIKTSPFPAKISHQRNKKALENASKHTKCFCFPENKPE